MATKPASKNAARKTSTATAVVNAGEVLLAQIVAATLAGSFVHTSPAMHVSLVEAGLVEINPEMTNDAGEIATRATPKGIETVNPKDIKAAETNGAVTATNAATLTPGATAIKSAFKLDDAVALPTIKRGGRGGNVYPFDEMGVNQSFFVAATSDKPDPAKSLASTVSSATARYAVEVEGETEEVEVKTYKLDEAGKRVKVDGSFVVLSTATETRPKMAVTRQFVVRSVEESGVKGARVWRTA